MLRKFALLHLCDTCLHRIFFEQQQHLLQDHVQQGKNLVAEDNGSTYHDKSEPAAPHHEEDLQARSREIKDHKDELRKKDKKEKKLKKEQRRLEKKEKKRLKGEQDTSEDKLPREKTSVLAGGVETDPDGSKNAPRPEGEILVRSPQPGTTTTTGGQEQFSSPPSARSSRFSSSYDCKPKSPAANSCAAAAGAPPTKVDLGPSWTTGTTNQFAALPSSSRAASKTRTNHPTGLIAQGGMMSNREQAGDPPTGETMRTISMRATHPSMGFRQQLNPASVLATADGTSPSNDLPEYQPRPRRTATPQGTGNAGGSSKARDLMMLRLRDGTMNTGNTSAVDPDLADAKAPAAVPGPVPAPPYEVVQPLAAIAAEAADAAFVPAPPPADGSTRTASSTIIGTTTGSSSGDDSTSSQIDPRAENLNCLELATTIKEMEQQLISTAGSTPSSRAGTRSRPYMRPSASGIFKVIASSGMANHAGVSNQGREGDESGSETVAVQEQDISTVARQDLPEQQEHSRPFEGATNRQHPHSDLSAPLSPSTAGVGGEAASPTVAGVPPAGSSPSSSPSSKFSPSMPKFRCPESPRQMGANGRPRTRPLPIDQKVLVFPEDLSSTTVASVQPAPPPPPTGSKINFYQSIGPNGPWPEDLVPPEAAHEHGDYTWMWNENAGPFPPTHLSQSGAAAASRTNHAAAIESDEAEPAQPSQQLHQEAAGPWRPCAPPPEAQ